VRGGAQIKLLARDGGLDVFAKSPGRLHKERAMPPGPELVAGRRWRLKERLARLREPSGMNLKRDALLIKLLNEKTSHADRVFCSFRIVEA
jgi:hypothetical protein